MESSAGLVLLGLRTAGSHLGNAEDIQNTLDRWAGLWAWVLVLHSGRRAAGLGSRSQKAWLPLLAELQGEWGLQKEPGRGWS